MKTYITMLLATFLLTSCLKPRSGDILDYRGIKPVVIIPQSNFPARAVFPTAVADSNFGVTKLNLTAKYSFQIPAPHDVKVTFKRDDDLIAKYNQTFNTAYKPLPADSYTMASMQVTISTGSQEGVLPITVIPSKISGTSKYIIAFTVTDAEGVDIPDNFKSMVYLLKGQ